MPRAPIKKTYSKKPLKKRDSRDVVNALFAQNLQKREICTKVTLKPRKIQIKELPLPDKFHHLIQDSFLERSCPFDDTFDKLLKSAKASPKKTQLNDESEKEIQYKNALDESITNSLIIEKESLHKKKVEEFSTLSSFSFQNNSNLPRDGYTDNCSIEQSYNKNFVEVHHRHIASTPAVCYTPTKQISIVHETISPITSNVHKSIVNKSYDLIHTWNFQPPSEFQLPRSVSCFNTTKGIHRNSSCISKKKPARKKKIFLPTFALKEYIQETDEKLKLEPKVALAPLFLNTLGITSSVRLPTRTDESLLEGSNFVSPPTSVGHSRSRKKKDEGKLSDSSVVSQRRSSRLTPIRYLHLRKRIVAMTETRKKVRRKIYDTYELSTEEEVSNFSTNDDSSKLATSCHNSEKKDLCHTPRSNASEHFNPVSNHRRDSLIHVSISDEEDVVIWISDEEMMKSISFEENGELFGEDVILLNSSEEEQKIESDIENDALLNQIENTDSNISDVDKNVDESVHSTNELTSPVNNTRTPVILKNGKSWRRSLLQLRKQSILYADEDSCMTRNTRGKNELRSKVSRKSMLSTLRNSTLFDLSTSTDTAYGSNNTRETYRERSIGGELLPLPLTRNNCIYEETPCERARNLVLRKCRQEKPLPFAECYSSTTLQRCRKIGEGVYGEVFLYKNVDGCGTVMKIIPIEGQQLVNDEPQKKFNEILSEIVIAMELSNLRHTKNNTTVGFSELKSVKCVQGCYPAKLIDLWNLYDETRNSENDSPEMFGEDQLYIILELANGGVDMETFEFNNASESLGLFKQIACNLAVAEQAYEFEHRDLHWGNVLISKSNKDKLLRYRLNGHEFYLASNGIEVSLIDFTLSRMKIDSSIIYNDISKDPDLFNATGEYQFDIYKLMQQKNNNEWEHFEPHTNVLWMHYILDKMVTAVRYTRKTSKVHSTSMRKLIKFKNTILKYKSADDLVKNEIL